MTQWLRIRWNLDRVVAILGLVALSPLMLALVLTVRAHDSGPGVIRLTRVGRHGSQFHMWKIRSMRARCSSGHAGGAALTAGDDPRITPFGRWMRRTRLDEIPQLLNVISGQMSLIGPRPETPEYVDERDPRWQAVLAAKPGIAGPTQLLIHDYEAKHLDGGPERYVDEILGIKLAIDAWYLEHASPMVDVLVAVAAVQRFGFGKRTTVLHHRVLQAVPTLEPLVL